jgi:protein-S-isoprenylcysteine O-methyltransferase Ste14
MTDRCDTPPVWMIVAPVLALAFRPAGGVPGPFGLILGLLVLAGGMALVVLAQRELRAHGAGAMPGATPSALVTTGPYRYSRNPIRLGTLAALAGLSLLIVSPIGIVVVPALWFVLNDRFAKPGESRMAAGFGDAWRDDSARARRWVRGGGGGDKGG